jgi:hypothetical protein
VNPAGSATKTHSAPQHVCVSRSPTIERRNVKRRLHFRPNPPPSKSANQYRSVACCPQLAPTIPWRGLSLMHRSDTSARRDAHPIAQQTVPARQGASPTLKKCSGLAFGLAQTSHAVAGFPLTALFEEFDALEALEDVALCTRGAGGAETTMLRHKNLLICFGRSRRTAGGQSCQICLLGNIGFAGMPMVFCLNWLKMGLFCQVRGVLG